MNREESQQDSIINPKEKGNLEFNMDHQTDYWQKEASKSFDVAITLFEGGHFLESAFFCHLSIEKMLKAHYSYENQSVPPKIHHLLKLAKKSHLIAALDENQLDFLAALNAYQLEGRYPASRERLYNSTSKHDFEKILNRTEVILSWLRQRLNLKI